MEMNEDGFLEELLALRRETSWDTNPSSTEINGFFSSTSWASTGFDALDSPAPSTIVLPNNDSFDHSFSSSLGPPTSFGDHNHFYLSGPDPSPFSGPDEYPIASVLDDEIPCKAEPSSLSSGEGMTFSEAATAGGFNNGNSIGGLCMDMTSTVRNNNATNITINSNNNGGTPTSANKSKLKKVEGQPSKNLMAERRRRKRLNDRLSMLRSVVPKISKMDRTSILGDTIDYMKELLDRINNLQEEADVGSDQLNVMSIFKDVNNSNDHVLVRNSPKFDVERRKMDTRVEVCCAGKPGLLLSTVTTLEALGLEIQQCVISCFNDFSLQASCSEEMEQKTLMSSEDIKQALFRNAGYGGRCL